jgi:hypothetical protein
MQAEQNEKVADGAPVNSTDPATKRQMSTIEFPYGDLDDAVEFAKAIQAVGGQSCEIEQVAAYLKQTPTSGAFRLRLSYPRVFGLTENERGTVRLTGLGMRIVDARQEQAARADAFLHVPLYRAIFEQYKGYTLPPPAALEREMAKLGVSSKQTDKARQAFERSAKQAGFTWAGEDRLSKPILKGEGSPEPETKPLEKGTPGAEQRESNKGGSGGGGEPPDRNELMGILLRFLPESGLDNDGLARWLRAAEVNLRMAYNINGSIKIEVAKDVVA